MIKKYIEWYSENLSLMRGISVISVILFSWILLNAIIQGYFWFSGIVIWFWGLSIANLVVQYKQSK